jgi:transcriptional regulator with XRE-family HTH domain
MNDRLQTISKLEASRDSRESYVLAKLRTLVPAQIRALRFKSDMPRQADLARAATKQQSQISDYETPGAANVTLETLARLAATFEVGLVVKFVPFSEMRDWENSFSQDAFNVVRLHDDRAFHAPVVQIPARELEGAAALTGGTRQSVDDQAAKQANPSRKSDGLPGYMPPRPSILMEAAGQRS